ncbi:MAG: S49 family peptidase [Rickettsiales bacterium]|nr:MAG: S49 family peptidase [Rickettsiales bacterium]
MSKKALNQSNNTITDTRPILSRTAPTRLEQVLMALPFGFGKSQPVVAVLRLEGVIGKGGACRSGLNFGALNKLIEKTFKTDSLDAVCLVINSPGGSPVQSELIASRITSLAKEKDIPVYSFVEDVAASGGYWLACAGDKIYASKSSIIGSIGVISSSFGFQDAIAKLGIERRVYTEGKTKSVLDPFQPAKTGDVKIIKKLQKEIHNHFIDTVRTRRGGKLTQSDDLLFNGEFWCGQTALDYGLIDGIDDLYSFIQTKYGDNVKIEYIENKTSWFKKKLGMHKIAKEFAQDLTETVLDSAENRLIQSKFDLK